MYNINSDVLSYALQYNFSTKSEANVYLEPLPYFLTKSNVNYSESIQDYFTIYSEKTFKLEESGSGNSLFLALARAILYKLAYENPYYEFILRNICFSDIEYIDNFKFDSDLALQQLIRRKLCLYWLKSLPDLTKTKYNT